MKILSLILARKSSKRIKNKNKVLFKKKNLLSTHLSFQGE